MEVGRETGKTDGFVSIYGHTVWYIQVVAGHFQALQVARRFNKAPKFIKFIGDRRTLHDPQYLGDVDVSRRLSQVYL